MATGVLPLMLGKFTRLAQYFSSAEKSYTGTIRFGFATDTYDAEGEPAGADCLPEWPLTLEAGSRGGQPLSRRDASRCRRLTRQKRLPERPPTNWRAKASRWN